ncbi:hypothetical protein ACFX5Q_22225 [Mesorhizobium sp. IMUNJ 23033]|uniref:hypothetical protein n=1 Tax=Mesorhizobium sp. IMUNJ 23033 TaxID=3378039 RepID=UPI00384C90AC
MINLQSSISAIENLLLEGSEASLTYAALECRLAIERICYERLRVAHDYISHDDLKRWQPRDIVNILIQEVDSKAASTFTLSVSTEPSPEGSSPPTVEEYEAMEFVPIGTHVGFNPSLLGKLWNALANLALHISVPESKDTPVDRYGDPEKIRAKVSETLDEIRRISAGTLLSSGFGEEVSFYCSCGAKNRRRLSLLKDGQTVSCINPQCDESYEYEEGSLSFGRRTFAIVCRKCGHQRDVPKKKVENLRTDQHVGFDCERCGDQILIQWRPMQAQRTNPK